MARKLSNKTNVDAPAGSFPYGRVRDNPGDNTGTPVNELLLGDMMQFFEKLMDDAGVTFNNQPENDSSGYQFYNALVAAIRKAAASESQKGSIEIATQSETNTGTDDARAVTPAKLAGRTATTSRAGVVELATQTEVNTGTDADRAVSPATLAGRTATLTRAGVIELATQSEVDAGTDVDRAVSPSTLVGRTATATRVGVIELATQTEVNTGTDADRAVTPATLQAKLAAATGANSVDSNQYVDGSIDDEHLATMRVKSVGVQLLTKVINIGDWNMDLDSIKNVTLTGVPILNIRSIDAIIRDDTSSFVYPLYGGGNIFTISVGSGNVTLSRTGSFDTSSFDSTSYNRGWITVTYEA